MTSPTPLELPAKHAERVTAMCHALDLEIAAQRRGKGNGQLVRLRNGRLQDHDDGGWTYLFDAARWPAMWTHPNALVRPEGAPDWMPAALVSTGRSVTLRLDAELRGALSRAEIREDEAAALQVLKERLIATTNGRSPSRPGRSAAVLGDGSPVIGEERHPTRFVDPGKFDQLNPAQQKAVCQALGSDQTYIWGPPGTGKTAVLTSVIEGCLAQGRSVLFVAPTNVAVDQALLRVCERLEHRAGFDHGLVQRLGDIALPELAERYGACIAVDRTEARVAAEIDARISAARVTQQRLHEQLESLAKIEAAVGHRDRMALQERKQRATVASLDRQVADTQSRVDDLRIRLDKKFGSRLARAFGSSVPQLEADLADQETELELRTTAAAGPRSLLAAAEEANRLAGQEVARLTAGLDDPTATAAAVKSAADGNQRALQTLDAERKDLLRLLQSNLRIVATTASMAVQRKLPLDDIDTVVVDEAAMLHLPTAFYLSGLSRRRVVFAGDFRQLPAVVVGATDSRTTSADQAQIIEWFARDPFRAGALVSDSGALKNNPRLVPLVVQYRMRPDICQVVNAVAYPDAPLRTGRDDESRLPTSPLLTRPIVLIDTHSRRTAGSTTTRNVVHAGVVRELIRGLQYDGVLPGRNHGGAGPGGTLGVIAPYRDQVRYLDAALTERMGTDSEGVVQTVHRFQGSERPLIILDTVAGAGRGVGRFFEESGVGSSTTRLINVALSRAQDHLMVVADVAFLREKLPPTSEVRILLDHLERRGQIVPVQDLLPVRAAAELAGLPDDERDQTAFFPADESFPAVEWDIQRAMRKVEIYCAFLSHNPVMKWGRILAQAARRNVDVTIFTRPEHGDESILSLVRHLVDRGCHIERREAMHEKVVVVDDILWHGSLNLLAHTRSTDLMMRMVNRAACADVRRLLDQARPTRAARPDSPPTDVSYLVYLDVPYEEKDEVRALGARWDPARKKWYVDTRTTPLEPFEKWLPKG